VSQAGALASLRVRGAREEAPILDGTGLELSVAGYPALGELAGPSARAEGRATLVREVPGVGGAALAARAGGSAAVGEYPFFDAAFLGGWESLRGYHLQRFAGDVAAFGGAELRVPLREVELFVRGDLGATLFADAGRVFLDGESPGGWHTALGGSLWFASPLGTLAVSFARGEESRFYLRIGEGF
jgi:outer membrane translocation and assembly module TamA